MYNESLSNGGYRDLPAHLERKGLIEDGIESLLVDLRVKLLLLVREDEDLHVRVRGATAVHGEKIGGLQDSHSQLGREKEGRSLENGLLVTARWQKAPLPLVLLVGIDR